MAREMKRDQYNIGSSTKDRHQTSDECQKSSSWGTGYGWFAQSTFSYNHPFTWLQLMDVLSHSPNTVPGPASIP